MQKDKPYRARIRQDGRKKVLGYFVTAEEAALAYARAAAKPKEPRLEMCPADQPEAERPMSKEEALRDAAEDGLQLISAETTGGYEGVSYHESASDAKPYEAQIWKDWSKRHLGFYRTAEEAALVYARAAKELGRNHVTLAESPSKRQAADPSKRKVVEQLLA